MPIEFEFDPNKRDRLINERGVDLLYAALIFEGPTLVRKDDRQDYSEERLIALGLVDQVPYTVVYTQRGSTLRLITAWKSGRRDYERYKESFP